MIKPLLDNKTRIANLRQHLQLQMDILEGTMEVHRESDALSDGQRHLMGRLNLEISATSKILEKLIQS